MDRSVHRLRSVGPKMEKNECLTAESCTFAAHLQADFAGGALGRMGRGSNGKGYRGVWTM